MDTNDPVPTRDGIPGSRKRRPAGPDPVRLLIAAVFWFASGVGLAAVIYCPGGDLTCLINAINTANGMAGADTIVLASGTYTLTAMDNDRGESVDRSTAATARRGPDSSPGGERSPLLSPRRITCQHPRRSNG